jgi:hypothetical protein
MSQENAQHKKRKHGKRIKKLYSDEEKIERKQIKLKETEQQLHLHTISTELIDILSRVDTNDFREKWKKYAPFSNLKLSEITNYIRRAQPGNTKMKKKKTVVPDTIIDAGQPLFEQILLLGYQFAKETETCISTQDLCNSFAVGKKVGFVDGMECSTEFLKNPSKITYPPYMLQHEHKVDSQTNFLIGLRLALPNTKK